MKIRTAMMASLVILAAGSARAVTFTFDDEYLLKYGTTFPGTSVTVGSTGLYQETATGASPVITRLVLGTSTAVPGEFIPDTTPGVSQALSLTGWGQSLNYGQKVDTVFNTTTGIAPYFQYLTNIQYGNIPGGGTPTNFKLNSVDLSSRYGSEVTLEGFLGSNLVDSKTVTLTSSYQTFTENWANVSSVRICNGAVTTSCPSFLSFNQVGMDNVRINESIAAVPEPATWGLMLMGLLGIGGLLRIQRKARGLRTATA